MTEIGIELSQARNADKRPEDDVPTGAASHSASRWPALSLKSASNRRPSRACPGEGMMELYPEGYGLAAVVGLTEKEVSTLVEEATAQSPVYIGSINAPSQIGIAGSDGQNPSAALSELSNRARVKG
jgi:hypothetical protein